MSPSRQGCRRSQASVFRLRASRVSSPHVPEAFGKIARIRRFGFPLPRTLSRPTYEMSVHDSQRLKLKGGATWKFILLGVLLLTAIFLFSWWKPPTPVARFKVVDGAGTPIA